VLRKVRQWVSLIVPVCFASPKYRVVRKYGLPSGAHPGIAGATGVVGPLTCEAWIKTAMSRTTGRKRMNTSNYKNTYLNGGPRRDCHNVVCLGISGGAGEVFRRGRFPRRIGKSQWTSDGFIMMPNEVEAYRKGAKKFEHKAS